MGILWNIEEEKNSVGLLLEILSSSNAIDGPLDQSSPKPAISNTNDIEIESEGLVDFVGRNKTESNTKMTLGNLMVDQQAVENFSNERGRSVSVREQSPKQSSRSRTPKKIRDSITHLLGWFQEADVENNEEVDLENTVSLLDMSKISFLRVDWSPKLKYYKPCSRLALLNSDQYYAFNYEMDLLKTKVNDFPLYFQWCFWVWNEKYIGVHSIIENLIDLKVTCKTLKELYENSKVSIFKKGLIPRRKHPLNIDGVSIDIQVDHHEAYEVFKGIIKIVVDGTLYKPDIDCMLTFT